MSSNKVDFDLAALTVNEILSFGSVLLLKSGVFYFFQNELSGIQIIHSTDVQSVVNKCKIVFLLCAGHWTVIYVYCGKLLLFDSTAYFAVQGELLMNGVHVAKGNENAYQQIGIRDKFCGQYCILVKKLLETYAMGVDAILPFYLKPNDFEANMFKMQVMTVQLRIGQEFRNVDVVDFINKLERLDSADLCFSVTHGKTQKRCQKGSYTTSAPPVASQLRRS